MLFQVNLKKHKKSKVKNKIKMGWQNIKKNWSGLKGKDPVYFVVIGCV